MATGGACRSRQSHSQSQRCASFSRARRRTEHAGGNSRSRRPESPMRMVFSRAGWSTARLQLLLHSSIPQRRRSILDLGEREVLHLGRPRGVPAGEHAAESPDRLYCRHARVPEDRTATQRRPRRAPLVHRKSRNCSFGGRSGLLHQPAGQAPVVRALVRPRAAVDPVAGPATGHRLICARRRSRRGCVSAE